MKKAAKQEALQMQRDHTMHQKVRNIALKRLAIRQ